MSDAYKIKDKEERGDFNKETMKVISITSIEKERVKIEKTEDYYEIFVKLLNSEELFLRSKEHLWVLGIDNAGYTSCVYIAALGIQKIVVSTAMDLFRAALQFQADKIVIAHNQVEQTPPQAKPKDLNYTNQMYHKARHLSIELIDHIIINTESLVSEKPVYYSYKEMNLIEFIKQDITYKTVEEAHFILEREKKDYATDKNLEGIRKGKTIGNREGRQQRDIEIIRNMLVDNIDVYIISKYTDTCIEDIVSIKKEMAG